jgi:hypothetical protein
LCRHHHKLHKCADFHDPSWKVAERAVIEKKKRDAWKVAERAVIEKKKT